MQGIKYGQPLDINGVQVSFYPAGHVLGSAQIKLDNGKEQWVISGDYKLESDGVAQAFEPVRCSHFVTESTFGLPVFNWQPQQEIFQELNNWWQANATNNKPTMVSAYSLGKAQRVLANIDSSLGPIVVHPAIKALNEITRSEGVALPETLDMDEISKDDKSKALFICPPMAMDSKWSESIKNAATGVLSGWMGLRGAKRRRNVDKGFILSDHADWSGLNDAIKNTGAENIYVTHGYTEIFTKWLDHQGYTAAVVKTEFEGESMEPQKTASTS